jgi:hypothetical protein
MALPDPPGVRTVGSELIYLLAGLDRQFTPRLPANPGRFITPARSCAVSSYQAAETVVQPVLVPEDHGDRPSKTGT